MTALVTHVSIKENALTESTSSGVIVWELAIRGPPAQLTLMNVPLKWQTVAVLEIVKTQKGPSHVFVTPLNAV